MVCATAHVCVWLYVNVCIIFFCGCMLSYLLRRVSHKRLGILTQCSAPDPMGLSIQRRGTLKYTLVPPHKRFNM